VRVGTAGKRVDLLIRQGATFAIELRAVTPAGEPKPIAGYTVRSQIRKMPSSPVSVASLSAIVTNAPGGVFTLYMTAAQTAALVAGETADSAASRYAWDVEIESPSGFVSPVAWGTVQVHPEVTR